MAGFFRKAGRGVANYGRLLADNALGTFGLQDVISEDSYKGPNAEKWDKVGNMAGKVSGTAFQIGASIAAPGVGGLAASSIQNLGGGFNQQIVDERTPQGDFMYQQEDIYNQPDMERINYNPNGMPTALSSFNNMQNRYPLSYARGGFVPMYKAADPIKGYADGDFVSAPDYLYAQSNNFTGPYSTEFIGQTPNFSTTPANGYYGPYASGYGQQTPSSLPVSQAQLNGRNNLGYFAALSGVPLGTALLGAYQTRMANKGLKQIQSERMPVNSATPELNVAYSRAQEMAKRGFTPEQASNFRTGLATSQNTAYQNAINQGGGNLASTINRALQSQNIAAQNEFAAQDAAQQQSNIRYADSFANNFQNIQDANVRNALSYRLAREQALGQAKSQGQTNLAGSLNALVAAGSNLAPLLR